MTPTGQVSLPGSLKQSDEPLSGQRKNAGPTLSRFGALCYKTNKGGGYGKVWAMKAQAASDSGTHGPGGVKGAMGNPNDYAMLNDTPGGPYSHMLGYTGDGGMYGDDSVDHRGSKFWFT